MVVTQTGTAYKYFPFLLIRVPCLTNKVDLLKGQKNVKNRCNSFSSAFPLIGRQQQSPHLMSPEQEHKTAALCIQVRFCLSDFIPVLKKKKKDCQTHSAPVQQMAPIQLDAFLFN